jgi:lysophospholipase L1-like esterase
MTPWILVLLTAVLTAVEPSMSPSFADLARRADAGESLTVVFLGGSLTWGANGTDPQRTSYRAHIANRLAARWPMARWNCVDAAIGGTGSRLGIFRFARDVARHKPDLVFLDHTVNDGGPGATDPDRLASCEAVVRSCVADLQVPTVFMVLAAGDMVRGDISKQPIRAAHLAIATAYGLPVGDAVELISTRIASGALTHAAIWDNPKDGCHPGDLGYALYAEAGWDALGKAVKAGARCAAPTAMLHADTYRTVARVPLAGLTPLPAGWKAGVPARISAWYDCLMSRWLDSVGIAERAAGAADPAAWELRFRGATVMLFGECTVTSGKLRVLIDGKPSREFKDGILDCRSGAGGTYKLDPTLATGLDQTVEHTLRLEPFDDRAGPAEWRIESVCVAGAGARVWR